jgi:hypothetical protein
MLSHSISVAELTSQSCLHDRIIQLNAGSKLLFQHDGNGSIASILLAPPGRDMGYADCNTQLIESNCEMLLRIQ